MAFLRELTLVALLMMAACSLPGEEEPSSMQPSSDALLRAAEERLQPGDPFPIEPCAEMAEWSRPPEDQQVAIWNDPRWSGVGKADLREVLVQDFLLLGPSASIRHDLLQLTGLWTLPDGAWDGCRDESLQQALRAGAISELWLFGHTAVGATVGPAGVYSVAVEPTGSGVQIVHLPRFPDLTSVLIVDADGVTLDELPSTEDIGES